MRSHKKTKLVEINMSRNTFYFKSNLADLKPSTLHYLFKKRTLGMSILTVYEFVHFNNII